MVHVVRERPTTPPTPKQATKPTVSEAQAITILAWLQSKHPKTVAALLRQYRIPLPEKPTSRQLNDALFTAMQTKGRRFHFALEQLVSHKLPQTQQHDSFLPQEGSKGGDVLGAAMKMGGETASGAAGGGWIGAALGLGSGITQVVANGQEKKLQAEAQRNSMFQSLVAMKNNRSGNSPDTGKSNTLLYVGGAIVLAGGVAFLIWKLTRPPAPQQQMTT